jgi:HPt (histidine-containing phosphotransfer) domain-containing protein
MKLGANRAQRPQDSPTGARRAAGTFDIAHLRRFTLGDKHLETEILGLFIAQVPITIAALKQAETDGDWYVAAHTLKGSARAVGARRLALLAAQAERLGGISDPNACRMMIRLLDDAVNEAQAFIGPRRHKTQSTT